MHILIISFWTSWKPHFETELEIAQNHIDNGDEVTFIYCDAFLPGCDANYRGDLSHCRYCVRQRIEGLSLLKAAVTLLPISKFIDRNFAQKILTDHIYTKAIDTLKKVCCESYPDLGMGLLSSLVSISRNHNLLLEKWNHELNTLYKASLLTFNSINNLLSQKQYDRAYIFNGRFSITRAAWRACENRNLKVIFHERGKNIHSYALFHGKLPHDRNLFCNNCIEAWEKIIDTNKAVEAVEAGSKFYHERISGIEREWYSFIKKQQLKNLPKEWDKDKYNIAIFTSSEDELVAIDDSYKNILYSNQFEGIEKIINTIQTRPEGDKFSIYIRLHPNLLNTPIDNYKMYFTLASKNTFVLPPDSEVDSYYLMQSCNKIITFGSTIGIEATFWNKPSILCGPAFYEGLDATYNPKTHDEVMTLLLDRNLIPKPKSNAIKYGYYLKTYGLEYKYVNGYDFGDFDFKGTKLGKCKTPIFILKILFKPKYFIFLIDSLWFLYFKKKKLKFSTYDEK